MSVTQAIAGEIAKGCSATCARALSRLVQLVVRLCWGYLHYWTFAIIGPIAAAFAWIRFRSGD